MKRISDVAPVSKAQQIALTMTMNGYSKDMVESTTGVKRSRIDQLRAPTVAITRSLVTAMLVDAYEIADTANEVVGVAKELAKLHGLNEPEKTVTLNVSSGDIQKQLSTMSNDELMRILSAPAESLVLEGEYMDAETTTNGS